MGSACDTDVKAHTDTPRHAVHTHVHVHVHSSTRVPHVCAHTNIHKHANTHREKERERGRKRETENERETEKERETQKERETRICPVWWSHRVVLHAVTMATLVANVLAFSLQTFQLAVITCSLTNDRRSGDLQSTHLSSEWAVQCASGRCLRRTTFSAQGLPRRHIPPLHCCPYHPAVPGELVHPIAQLV